MKIEDLAFLLGKTKQEVEQMLQCEDVIEVNLKERKERKVMEKAEIEVIM